jgi:DNA-directed RNA polymerase subunit beta'
MEILDVNKFIKEKD